MGKSVAIGVVPYVPCSKMKLCDIGSISKSLEAAMVKLQALTKGYEGDVHTRSATSTHGVPREPKPPDLYQGERLLPYECSNSSPTLRSKGKTPLLPSFNGENSRAFVSWLFDVECYFENKCFSDSRKCEMVVSCLKGVALFWYNTLNLSRMVKRKGKLSSWFKLERNMRLKFLPCSTMNDLWAELKTLKQNSLSVIEYAKLFEELHFVCDIEVDFVQERIRFYLGLKSEIARRINLEMVHSYGELFELALFVERSLSRPRTHEVLAKDDSLEAIKTVGKEEGLNQKDVVPCLVSLESKAKDAQREDVGDALTHHKEESAPTHSIQVLVGKQHGAKLVVSSNIIYLSPLELSINKKLQQPFSLKMDGFLSSFEGDMCWDSSKGEARKESWVIPYSSAPNVTSYTSHGPNFKAYILMGPDLSKKFDDKSVTTPLLPYTILVYDPGGSRDNPSLEVCVVLL